tara:strand:- start:101 stop:757 length:657 start_codon:yes stop_codon:yes gene_type:complete
MPKYYPPSQITTDLYTNGNEYQIKSTGEIYKGPYYSLLQGKYYTGKNPNANPTLELSKIQTTEEYERSWNESVENVYKWDGIKNYMASEEIGMDNNENYFRLNQKASNIVKYLPFYTSVPPNEEEYVKGFFTRYFLKKNNQIFYGETTKEEYNKFIKSSPSVQSELYTSISLIWALIGEKEKVYKTNKYRVNLIETKNKWYGFPSFFKEDYLKYYLAS